VHKLGYRLNSSEVVEDGMTLYECTLIRLHQLMHHQGEYVGQRLGERLAKTMDETDWSVVLQLGWCYLLSD
jgi:hypothetical protein